MTELRLHEDLYDGLALEDAIEAYRPFATIESSREASRFHLRVTALPAAVESGVAESTLCAELMNFALGRSIERSRAGGAAQ